MSAWKFEVGKQVVCRSPEAGRGFWFVVEGESIPSWMPGPGDVLTVRHVEVDANDEAWLAFEEVPGNHLFEAAWFEPVRRTDISALRDLLAPTDTKELEPA